MPARPSWFRVHPRVVLAQADACVADLVAPEFTHAVLDLDVVGLDGPVFRHQLQAAQRELADSLTSQEDARRRLEEARAAARELSEAFFAWRKRLIARLRYASTQGADPAGDFHRVFRYRAAPRARAAGLVNEGEHIFAALASREATLRPHGIDVLFVGEGQRLLRRLTDSVRESEEAMDAQKEATRRMTVARAEVQRLLLALSAADEAAAIDRGRPPAFPMNVLRNAERNDSDE